MKIPRANPELNEVLPLLDEKFIYAGSDFAKAWDSLAPDELHYIDGELEKCLTDRRYYMENYHTIKNEHGQIQTLFPFWDQQEIIWEVLAKEWKAKGCFRGIVLKPRQCGGTAWTGALTFHCTIFTPQAFTLMMGHDEGSSAEIYRRVWDAYNNLPWWMRAEYSSKQQERHVIFQRGDEKDRIGNPGLNSVLLISNAQKAAGIAIGRSIRSSHFSEVSRWPDATVFTSDIKPSMNARDILAVMESTAFGRSGLFWNMWRAAESGKSAWVPIFIPVYKVRKYFLPVYKSDNFVLTPEEKSFKVAVKERENFTIPLGYFKWRRNDIIETINATGSDETHDEAYPETPKMAFISSGDCAYPRKCLDQQEKIHVRDPLFIGEIEYAGPDTKPILHLHPPSSEELEEPPEFFNRLSVWETPDENDAVEYYCSADVSSGTARDFSCAEILRLGGFGESHVQVAEWHGKMNPAHFAMVLAALGYWYHSAEIAVEYQQAGITTGDELQWQLDYPNIYRWKNMDKITGTMSLHTHWLTNSKTRESSIDRVCQRLLDKSLVLRSKHLINEMRDFGRYEGEGKAMGLDNFDDMSMSLNICLGAVEQAGARYSATPTGGTSPNTPQIPKVFAIYDHFMRQVAQVESAEKGQQYIADAERKHKVKLGWTVKEIAVTKANTAYSPIFHSTGAEHELYNRFNVPARDIRPDLVYAYRQKMREESFGYGDDD